LELLRAQEDCKQLAALVDEYAKRNGRRPARMMDLVQAGLLREPRTDPEGFSYVFGEDGKVELNLDSPLLEQQLLIERYNKVLPH
jgi:hypothetical protein